MRPGESALCAAPMAAGDKMITPNPNQSPTAGMRHCAAWICGLVLMLEGYDIAAAGYVVPSLVDAWHLKPTAFGQALAAANVGMLFGSLLAGWSGERIGRKSSLIGSMAIFGMFSFASAFAGSPSQLAALRLFTGLGLGSGTPLTMALASELAPPERRGRLLFLVSAGAPIGYTVGGLIASQLVPAFGWSAIFLIGGALPLVLLPLFAKMLIEYRAPDCTPSVLRRPSRVAALFSDAFASRTVLLWVINLLSLMAIFLVVLWLPALLHATGFGTSSAVFAATMYSAGLTAGPLLMALWVDRVGMTRILTWSLALGGVCVLVTVLADLPLWLLCFTILGAGIGGGSQAGVISLSSLVYPPDLRATGAGWALGIGRLGSILGPLLGGVVLTYGHTPRNVLIAASVAAFAAMALMSVFDRLAMTSRQCAAATQLRDSCPGAQLTCTCEGSPLNREIEQCKTTHCRRPL